MNILITGGLGFIGSHLSNYYSERGDDVYIIDNASTSLLLKTKALENNIKVYAINLSKLSDKDHEVIDTLIANSNLIYHCAGSVGVKYIDKNPKLAIRNNFNLISVLFPIFEKHQKKVVYFSTSEVYGETEDANESDTLKIGSPEVLRWGYACTKLMGEFMIRSFTFPYVIIRPFNITGQGQLSDHGMVLPTFINKAKYNQEITIYDDGLQYRSFCDIRDALKMFTLLGEDNQFNGQIFNVGNSKNKINIKDLAKLVVKILNSKSKIIHKDFNKEFSTESGDIIHRKVNTHKMKHLYQCKYSNEDIIKSMIGVND